MSRIRKAVFPVGGLGTRFLPATKAMPKEMLAVVDKPLIQYVVEEALDAGIEEIIFVTGKGKSAIEDHFDSSPILEKALRDRGQVVELEELQDLVPEKWQIAYTRQVKPLGLGHAVWSARHLIGNEPFAVLLADDFILGGKPCLAEMIEAYEQLQGNYLAVMEVKSEETRKYGMIKPVGEFNDENVISIEGMIEKPSHSPPSHYAIIGRYILQPEVLDILAHLKPGAGNEIQLTDALVELLGTQAFYGYRFSGRRFDCGTKEGLLKASIHAALQREDLAEAILKEIDTIVQTKNQELHLCA